MKQVIINDQIEFGGRVYPINKGVHGCYRIIIERTVDQLLALSSYHSKVLINMFVLHSNQQEQDNAIMSRLMRKMTRRIDRKKNGGRLAYVWVRELSSNKKTHYHLALFVNGNTFKGVWGFFSAIQRLWQGLWDIGSVHYIEKIYNYVRNDYDMLMQAVYHLSYFAKTRTKERCPIQVNEFSTSRLQHK